MRMKYYFAVGALLLAPCLAATLISGFWARGSAHLWIGLISAILAALVHTLVILFMLITGRVLREAIRTRPLGPELLQELNEFFARRKAYPLTILGAFSIVAAGVLGLAGRGFGISHWWHAGAGVLAVGINAWTLLEEWRALCGNQALLDRAARALDRIDAERGLVDVPVEPPKNWSKLGLVWGLSAWLPYLYWALINWRGDFSRVSIHPWVELSALGFGVWWLARKPQPAQGAS